MRILLKASRIAAAAAVVIALTLLAWQCLDIYQAGIDAANPDANGLYIRPMYSREDVAGRLSALALPLGICAGLVLIAVTLHAVPGGIPSQSVGITPENHLRLMKSRIDALPEAAQREERLRRRIFMISGMLLALSCAYCMRYLMDPASFPPWDSVNLDTAIGRLLLRIAPPAACSLLLGIGVSFACRESARREISLLRNAPKTSPSHYTPSSSPINRVRIFLYALAVAFIVLGVMNGGLRDVLYKAINICTECIGLG